MRCHVTQQLDNSSYTLGNDFPLSQNEFDPAIINKNGSHTIIHSSFFIHCLRFELRLGLLLDVTTTGGEGGCSCSDGGADDSDDVSILWLLGEDCSLDDEGVGEFSLDVWVV